MRHLAYMVIIMMNSDSKYCINTFIYNIQYFQNTAVLSVVCIDPAKIQEELVVERIYF
jgi:hypothetical protein